MPSPRKPTAELTKRRGPLLWLAGRSRRFWFTVAVFAPSVLYVGTYFLLVEPRTLFLLNPPPGHWRAVEYYRWPLTNADWQSPRLSSMFEPLNDLDRKVRPATWEPKPWD